MTHTASRKLGRLASINMESVKRTDMVLAGSDDERPWLIGDRMDESKILRGDLAHFLT